MGTRAAITVALAFAFALPPAASASQFVDLVRSRVAVTLKVDRANRAIVYYSKSGSARHVLAQGAVNARQPSRAVRQVRFRIDYSGGRGLWRHFRNACGAYDGPSLPQLVAACKAPNGSYWAVQEWMVDQPNFGVLPWTVRQHQYSIRVSHWSTPVAQLELHSDWIYNGRFHEVFGRATYLGKPVYGFASTSRGAPTDGYGRLLYLDTFGSRYGAGWRRENGFLPHRPTGVFCAGLYRHGGRPPGNGSRYRVTMIGPGVTPDVQSTVGGLHDFRRGNSADASYEAEQNGILDRLAAGGRWCHRH
ncbi:MAG TPA: hypothetical protein VH297_02350 [Gaiellaceae bacterium]|jgi:hypothetical protein